MKRKILVTGATGFVASIVRPAYKDCNVFLMSRGYIKDLSENEVHIKCSNIEERYWWKEADKYKPFDQVLHFAEPVKKDSDVDKICRSHLEFINWGCNNSRQVIYPLTAYLYDDARVESSYVKIKKCVSKAAVRYENISLPIIHPVIDVGDGLCRIVELERKIPFVNIFCSFDSTIYIVESKFLSRAFCSPDMFGVYDVFSDNVKISELFNVSRRNNFTYLSNLIKACLSIVLFLSPVRILLNGRCVNHDKIY